MFQMRLSTYFLRELRRRNFTRTGTVFIGIVGDGQLNNLNKEVCCAGYMDRTIRIPRLDKARRLSILDTLIPSSLLASQEGVKEWLCEQTASYSAADLHSLCSVLIHRATEEASREKEMESMESMEINTVETIPNKEEEEKKKKKKGGIITKELCLANLNTTAPSSSRELRQVQPLEGGFQSLFGVQQTIERVKDAIIQPLLHPEIYRMYNLQPPSGALFYGPSGTGKSAMIQAIAMEVKNQIQVIEISCTDILGKVCCFVLLI